MVIVGASGVVGRHLASVAGAEGWAVTTVTRGSATENAIQWNPEADEQRAVTRALDGAEVVVNLAGASLSEGRLDAAHRARVLNSRVIATQALVRAQKECAVPPPLWLQASAVGYYGDCGDSPVDEYAPMGAMFLSDVCHQWEAATHGTRARVVVLRMGLVLADDAPAWQKMLAPIKWGVGGALGSGKQWYAWITADDLARACLFLAHHQSAEGVFNLATPHPIQQREMARMTAKSVKRVAIMPAPAFVLKAALGGVASELLLPSCRAVPARLQEMGFEWEHPTFEDALTTLL
jgi:uncharacterized protein (TIGR01777 family)